MIGEAGLTTALHDAGYTLTERSPDYVVLGETRTYSFERITHAIRLIGEGARFIATNPDATGPSADGPLPATGSVAALISRATGAEPYFVGKPNPLMMRSALNAIDAHSETTTMIGDRMDTDVVVGPRGRDGDDPRADRGHDPRAGGPVSPSAPRGSSTRSPTCSRSPGRGPIGGRRPSATAAVLCGIAFSPIALTNHLLARGSHSGRAPTPPARAIVEPVTLEWVGDMAMSSQLGLPPGGVDRALGPANRTLHGADIALGNLEGTLSTGGESKCGRKPGRSCFAFQAPPSVAGQLKALGFDLVNQANNHSLDFGASGRSETIGALRRAKLAFTGMPARSPT